MMTSRRALTMAVAGFFVLAMPLRSQEAHTGRDPLPMENLRNLLDGARARRGTDLAVARHAYDGVVAAFLKEFDRIGGAGGPPELLGLYKDVLRESDELAEMMETPRYEAKVAERDMLSEDERRLWGASVGATHDFSPGVLTLAGADVPGRSVMGVVSMLPPRAGPWHDVSLDIEFTILEGGFEMYLRYWPDRKSYRIRFAPSEGYEVNKAYRLTIHVKGSLVSLKLPDQPENRDRLEVYTSRTGGIGFGVNRGSRISISRCRLKILWPSKPEELAPGRIPESRAGSRPAGNERSQSLPAPSSRPVELTRPPRAFASSGLLEQLRALDDSTRAPPDAVIGAAMGFLDGRDAPDPRLPRTDLAVDQALSYSAWFRGGLVRARGHLISHGTRPLVHPAIPEGISYRGFLILTSGNETHVLAWESKTRPPDVEKPALVEVDGIFLQVIRYEDKSGTIRRAPFLVVESVRAAPPDLTPLREAVEAARQKGARDPWGALDSYDAAIEAIRRSVEFPDERAGSGDARALLSETMAESDMIVEKVLTPDYQASVPEKDLLAAGQRNQWTATKGARFAGVGRELIIEGIPGAPRGRSGLVRAGTGLAPPWHDFVLDIEFTILSGGFELHLRDQPPSPPYAIWLSPGLPGPEGSRAGNSEPRFELNTPHRVQVTIKASSVRFAMAGLAQEYSDRVGVDMARSGGIAFAVLPGSKVILSSCKLKVLR